MLLYRGLDSIYFHSVEVVILNPVTGGVTTQIKSQITKFHSSAYFYSKVCDQLKIAASLSRGSMGGAATKRAANIAKDSHHTKE